MHSNGQSVTQGRGGTAFLGFFLEVFWQIGKECSVNTTCALNDNDNRAGIVYLLLPSRFVPLSHVSNSKNFFRTN